MLVKGLALGDVRFYIWRHNTGSTYMYVYIYKVIQGLGFTYKLS